MQLDLASVFLAAQQAKASEQRMRYDEMAARRQEEAFHSQQGQALRDQEQAREQALREREQQRLVIEKQKKIFGLRSRVANDIGNGEYASAQELELINPGDEYLGGIYKTQMGERDRRLADEKAAFDRQQEGAKLAMQGDRLAMDKSKNAAEIRKTNAEIAKANRPEQPKDLAADLRKEFQGQQVFKDTQTVAASHQKVMSTSPTGPGDMSMIFGYMKMLDPGSTVREGEYATAQNSGSVPQNVVAMYNRAIAGEKLADDVRNQFRAEAGNIMQAQLARYDATAGEYARLAKAQGIDPSGVILDLGVKRRAPPDSVAPQEQTQPEPSSGGQAAPGKVYQRTVNGETRQWDGQKWVRI